MEILRRRSLNPEINSARIARRVAVRAVISDPVLSLGQKIGVIIDIQSAYRQEVRTAKKS